MLNKQDILRLIKGKKLVENYIDLDKQVTPNGFDLTVGAVFAFNETGAVDFSNKERAIPACSEMMPQKQKPEDKFGWWFLEKGTYKIRTNETVNIPNDFIAIAFPRSTLLRMGAFIQNAVWDAGFSGRSEFILVVGNPHGLRLKQNARINQLIFLPINEVQEGYKGIYQNL
ncbi:MAG: deoxyuridine 5'-triphosphate nucleotidohydrolase [Candidatus Omnitrophica bacterium]|nr:deoxyuridine 5'-triphosphate nucleotidohydrolase [Candidatus Omnitrophota bacterium]